MFLFRTSSRSFVSQKAFEYNVSNICKNTNFTIKQLERTCFCQQDHGTEAFTRGQETCTALKFTSEAVKNYLCNFRKLHLNDATFISQNAPVFTFKLKNLVDGYIIHNGVQHSRISMTEDFLMEETMDELEPFLESIGMPSHLFDEVQPMAKIAVGGKGGLLAVVVLLEKLGFERRSIWSLMASNNHLLASSVDEIERTIHFLRGFGLKKEHVKLLIQQIPEIIRPNLKEEMHPFLQKMRELKVKKPVMHILLRNHARFLALHPTWDFQKNLNFLSSLGLDEAGIKKVVRKHPVVLIQGVEEKLIPKVEFLKNEGILDQDIAHFLICFPSFFSYDFQETLKPKLNYLSELGLTRPILTSILTRYPPILGYSIENKMKPLVALLEDYGIKGKVFEKLLIGTPSIFGSSIDKTLKKVMQLLNGLEERPASMSIVLAWGCRTGKGAIQQKIKYLNKAGLSPEDINSILKVKPYIMRLDLNVLKFKVNYLTKDMKFPIKELVKCPSYLSMHVMKKVKPRYKVLALLKSKHVVDNISLTDLTKLSDNAFAETFVKPYSDSDNL